MENHHAHPGMCWCSHVPLATTGTEVPLGLDEEALLDWVGVCGWLGVCWSFAPSGCGDAVADAVADAVGPGRPGVLGAALSEEQT